MGQKRVLDELEKDTWILEASNYKITTTKQLEIIVEHFYEKIEKRIQKHSKVKNTQYSREKPWWTAELQIERKRVRAHRRRFQRSEDQLK